MCITFFCNCPNIQIGLKLVLAFNREEKTLRQTLKLAPFDEDPNIYGGRDMQSGGTWLGVNIQTGILVFLTNFIMPPPYSRQGISRGMIVNHFLVTSLIPPNLKFQADNIVLRELTELSKKSHLYSPFNLVVCNLRTGNMFYICSEWKESNPMMLQKKKVYGLSNSDIKTQWQKTVHGTQILQSILSKIDKLNEEQLLLELGSMMQDKTSFSDLPGQFSTIFVQPYWSERCRGQRRTKSTTLILNYQIQNRNEIVIKEITYGVYARQQVVLRFII